MKKEDLLKKVKNAKIKKTHYNKGLLKNAEIILNSIDADDLQIDTLRKTLLNGANNWVEWAYNGNGLIYDEDIANLLFTKKEIKTSVFKNNNPYIMCNYAIACGKTYDLIKNIFIKNTNQVA